MGRRAEPAAARSAEELRERIREQLERIPDDQLWRVDFFVRAIVEDDRFLWNHAVAEAVEPTDDERASMEARREEDDDERHSLDEVERELGL